MSLKGDRSGHARWRTLLEKHIDGELDAAGRQELFGHLEACEECRETLEAEERLIDHLSRLPRLSAPSDLRAAILREAARERAEALQPLTEDTRYSELFTAAPAAVSLSEPEAARASSSRQERKGGRGDSSRRRSLWRGASPSLAIAFLITAATLRVLDQGGLRSLWPAAADTMAQLAAEEASIPTADVQTASLVTSSALFEIPDAESTAFASHRDPGVPAGLPVSRHAQPLWERAVGPDYPVPAEQERPVSQILVLRLSEEDSRNNDLADLLQKSMESRPGAQIRLFRQWEREGHRYRSFTVDLAADECDLLLGALHDLCPVRPGEPSVRLTGIAGAMDLQTSDIVDFCGCLEQYDTALSKARSHGGPAAQSRRLCFVLPND